MQAHRQCVAKALKYIILPGKCRTGSFGFEAEGLGLDLKLLLSISVGLERLNLESKL